MEKVRNRGIKMQKKVAWLDQKKFSERKINSTITTNSLRRLMWKGKITTFGKEIHYID